jgi:hypothetical protein
VPYLNDKDQKPKTKDHFHKMLTADLAMSWRRGNKIFPRFIRTDDADYWRDTESLNEIFEIGESEGKTRGELDKELEEYVGAGTDYRILRGFIKLLNDRCEFQTSSVAEPIEIRRQVFLEAKKFQPVFPHSKQREKVLETVAEEFNTDATTIAGSLYADLSAQQKLLSFESVEPLELLDRYNLAQAQALLYKCVEMKIWIEPQSSANYRQIFSSIKYFRLIHSIIGNPVNGYQITLTGAASLFHRSQKYGIQMSVFLPALLNFTGWRMRAEIAQKSGENLFYELDSRQNQLRSHYLNEPDYDNPVHRKLIAAWTKHQGIWQLAENKEIVDLGKTALTPDFLLFNESGEKVYLDILGFWTPKSLQKRVEEIAHTGFKNYIIAAWEELRGSREEPTSVSENVLLFKSKLDPHLLELTAEKIINADDKR